jgi:hypothetical protein
VSPDGGFLAAFDPKPLEPALPALAQRQVPSLMPVGFAVSYRDDPAGVALDKRAAPRCGGAAGPS